MNRREFCKKSIVATVLMSGIGTGLLSCTRDLRSELMCAEGLPQKRIEMDPVAYRILYYASLAPSGHNSQPWFVRMIGKTRWIIGSDKDRWLPQVDGSNREVMLSLGAFIENLVQAANALGYAVETLVTGKDVFDPEVVLINISKSKAVDIPLQRIITRRTVKSNMLQGELKLSDVNDFKKEAKGHLHYFPSGTTHSKHMAKEAVNNFIIQFNNEEAVSEAANWTRLKDEEIKKYRDGLTPEGMEITGLAGFYVRNFMSKKDVMGKTFREKGIEKIEKQVKEGAGWMVITSEGNNVKDLIETGRRFQRIALRAREKMIAIHPMTQALEERQGQKKIKENHPDTMIPQFMLRVGYLSQYPDPVSLRRPVDWFVRT
ncbi:MAG: hypothetical protein A2277_21665 [Desulfobacterales bacterium RIFOXYA12_FULL_46_15]|nr:MAG: hypothetical protein A2277_21665 [Desulfobacterales bacterium RIFOXYA12_FULL_46_15]